MRRSVRSLDGAFMVPIIYNYSRFISFFLLLEGPIKSNLFLFISFVLYRNEKRFQRRKTVNPSYLTTACSPGSVPFPAVRVISPRYRMGWVSPGFPPISRYRWDVQSGEERLKFFRSRNFGGFQPPRSDKWS